MDLPLSKLSLEDCTSKADSYSHEPPSFLSLPDELLENIAAKLQGDRKLQSLLNFVLCSKRLRDVGTPILWKDLTWGRDTWAKRARIGAAPPEWQYVEYILFDGSTAAFWEGLRSDLHPEELDLSWEGVLLKRWPRLKAVIEEKQRRPFALECPVHAVWICSRNRMIERAAENLISRIIRVLYGNILSVSKLARDSLGIAILKFTIFHQLAPMVDGKTRSTTGRTGYRTKSNPFTSSLPSRWDPDANLSDTLLLGLDLHLLSDSQGKDIKRMTSNKGKDLHTVCRMAMQALDTPKLSLHIKCERAIDIFLWMFMIHMGTSVREYPPHELYATIPSYQGLADFTGDVTEAQRWICEKITSPRNAEGSEGLNLPSRIFVKSTNDPSRPQPNCKHAEIDLRDYETSRVARFGQCIYGGMDHRAYRDGIVMTEDEFKKWKIRTKATFTKET